MTVSGLARVIARTTPPLLRCRRFFYSCVLPKFLGKEQQNRLFEVGA
jgi:hypothetical protein